MNIVRTTLAACALAAIPFVAQAQETTAADVDANCGPSGSLRACAQVVAALPPGSALRTRARQQAIASGFSVNTLNALVSNAGNQGVPGTAGQDDDEKTSGNNESPVQQGNQASPT
jgi:hypothetical protein